MAKIIPIKKVAKQRPKYKYTLEDQLHMLPRNLTVKAVELHLKEFGITRDSFYDDRRILFGSDFSIPSDRLFIYAKVFDCPIQDLLNQEVNATSIRQKNVKLKTGMS
jgi:hypothetical protein